MMLFSPLTSREDLMYYNNISQTRTFKIVEKDILSTDDLEWIRSLLYVSCVTLQEKTIRVMTDTEDAIVGIISSIKKKFCNSYTPKLSPLF
jgi:hypothetical protein